MLLIWLIVFISQKAGFIDTEIAKHLRGSRFVSLDWVSTWINIWLQCLNSSETKTQKCESKQSWKPVVSDKLGQLTCVVCYFYRLDFSYEMVCLLVRRHRYPIACTWPSWPSRLRSFVAERTSIPSGRNCSCFAPGMRKNSGCCLF